MTNSHGYVLEYPRIRVDHFDQAKVPLPASLLVHRRSISLSNQQDADSLPFAPDQTHFDHPLLYLLTHIHTDHLKGLDRPGITAPIYCSAATKQLLLKYERQKTRIEKDRDGEHSKHISVVRPYAHLRVTENHATARAKLSGFQSTSLDLLHPLPYNVPTKIQYTPTSTVTLTLIESNHMFGGTMFLIQGANGAVLHTGDMRAEPWWCEALTRNPFLSPYLCWSKPEDDSTSTHHAEADNWADHIESFGSTTSSSLQAHSQNESQSENSQHQSSLNSSNGRTGSTPGTRNPRQSHLRLRNIYLDTELLLCNQKVPTKQQACLDMVALMRVYPPSTVFFLNCWTWGYEDMIVVTAKAFGCKIHVDRFKYIMYKAARTEAPFLADVIIQDGSKTRFHACEKRNVCPAVQRLASRYSANADPVLATEALAAYSQIDSSSADARQRWGPYRSQPDPLLVYVNPGQISADRWPGMFQDTKQRLEAAQRHETAWPEALVVPMERHSTLPELQMFVGLFRPKTVSPNTILDPKGGLDYYLLHHLFGHLLAGADDRRKLADEGLLVLGDKTWSFYEAQLTRAREQAQAKRNGRRDAADSTEAVRAASGSLNASESVGESIDAVQLEMLSKLRGISFKGLMMQNMAGNLAAMLEIERWRRIAGIDEPSEGLDAVLQDSSLGETQTRTDASVSSVDYDADHSQLAETQALGLHNRGLHRDEPAPPVAASSADDEAAHARACASSPPAGSAPSHSPAAHETQGSHASAPEEEVPTALTEDLASRYLNVLIHHFNVSFHRTDASYVHMWESVRQMMPADAQKVEEHWFRETGVLPPLWDERNEQPEVSVQPLVQAQPIVQTKPVTLSEETGGMFCEILSSFVDMLAPAPAVDSEFELVPVSTALDRTVALELILRHFAKVGFHTRTDAESSHEAGHSHASCPADLPSAEWKALAAPLGQLTHRLSEELQRTPALIHSADAPRAEFDASSLCLQLAGLLLSYRPLNSIIAAEAVQALLDAVIRIVETVPSDAGRLPHGAKVVTALACGTLRAEEVDESVLAPFEGRLLALVHDPNGPMSRMESLPQSEPGLSGASQSQIPVKLAQPDLVSAPVEPEPQEVESMEEDASSIQIRPPRPPAPVAAQAVTSRARPSTRSPPVVQQDNAAADGETDSIVATQPTADEDTIESVVAAVGPLQASQASSATQEEDETQSEEDLIGSLPVVEVRVGGERRGVARTSSMPSLLRGSKAAVDAVGWRLGRKRQTEEAEYERRNRRSRK